MNRGMTMFIRRSLYGLKKAYGCRVDLYKLRTAATNYKTGVKTYTKSVTRLRRCVVLPAQIQRDVSQTITAISANKGFVYGATYDAGTRKFVIDARDVPIGYEPELDDWLVYDERRYEIKDISVFEQRAGWIIIGKETLGVAAEQIHSARVEDTLSFESEATHG